MARVAGKADVAGVGAERFFFGSGIAGGRSLSLAGSCSNSP